MASKFITLAPYIEKSPFLYKMVKPIANAYAHIAGYRQMGLKYDDLIVEENHQTQKALSRLTAAEGYDRAWRMRRAVQCSILQRDLPKNEWTTVEEDVRYVTPLIKQIQKADDERLAWDTMKVEQVKKH